MTVLVLLRHGESVWNQENRFTGWTDVDLSARGVAEAREAGVILKARGLAIAMNSKASAGDYYRFYRKWTLCQARWKP